jgi:hypothetical protein
VGDVGHVVHIERLEGHGVRVWLDGVPVRKLIGWSLVEELRPPSTLTLTIKTDAIVWGPPTPPAPDFADDGLEHFVVTGPSGRRTPSGKYACQTCGEAWVCSTATRRLDRVSDAPLGSEHGDEGHH